jgi:hypothetical protein
VDRRRHPHRRSHFATLALSAMLASCGGGGGEDAASRPAMASERPVEQSDLEIAQLIYEGIPRTPPDFYSDPMPSGQDHVATLHLKNADVDASASASPLYELCTNDWNQALAWSETNAQSAAVYANLVETNDDARYFEFGRVRPGEPQFYVRTRVFKCAYLDRSSADLRVEHGPAGRLNQRPISAQELRTLSEYLWQFTTFNNYGYAVLKSSGATIAGGLSHTLIIGKLVRSGLSAGCDRIDVLGWRHSVDADGELQLDVQTLWSFGARESVGVASLCSS